MIARWLPGSPSKVAIRAEGNLPQMADGPHMVDGAPAPVALEESLDGVLGFEVLAVAPDRASARVVIENRIRQPYGLVHGGAYAALAESLAARATASGLAPDTMPVGLSNFTSFLRPAGSGKIHAEARCRHRGQTTWVWDVDMSDDSGRSCAVTRVTLAVRSLETFPPGHSGAEDDSPGGGA